MGNWGAGKMLAFSGAFLAPVAPVAPDEARQGTVFQREATRFDVPCSFLRRDGVDALSKSHIQQAVTMHRG